MTKMAQYEKNHKVQDKRVLDYFLEDYVYINNFKTRLGITIMMMFFIGVGAFRIVVEDIIFPTSLWEFIEVYIMPYFYPWLCLVIIYTIISSLVYSAKYNKARKRKNEYKKCIKELKQYEKQHANDEEVVDET